MAASGKRAVFAYRQAFSALGLLTFVPRRRRRKAFSSAFSAACATRSKRRQHCRPTDIQAFVDPFTSLASQSIAVAAARRNRSGQGVLRAHLRRPFTSRCRRMPA